MKTAKTIITLIILSFILASCTSDEQKALNYVKEEILPEEAIEQYLMLFAARENNNVFWGNVEVHLNSVIKSITVSKQSYRIELTGGWGHYSKIGYSSDYWTFGSRHGEIDSQKILESIRQKVTETIEIKNEDNLYEDILNYDLYDLGDWYNAVLFESAATYINERKGDAKGYYDHFRYEWLTKSEDQQNDFIDALASFLAFHAFEFVKSKDFKLIDAQGVKIGEDTFKVTYLLEPQLKIVFDVSKVGDTFCCDNIIVDGSIGN